MRYYSFGVSLTLSLEERVKEEFSHGIEALKLTPFP